MWQKLLKIFAAKNSNNTASIFKLYKKKIILGAIFSLLPIMCVFLVQVIVIFGPVMMAQQFIDDTKNDVAIFFEKVGNVLTLKGWCSESDGTCQRKAEQKYYEQLNDVYNEYKDKGVEIDVQLITATILYGKVLSEDTTYLDDTKSNSNSLTEGFEDIKLGDIKKLASKMVSGSRINYDNYRKYLEETYVEKRFSNLYNSDEKKAQIVDEIMSFASIQNKTNNFVYSTLGIGCSTISLRDVNDGSITVHELEEYVAGVVQAENGGAPLESRKLQAVAARSLAVNRCDQVLENSPNVQVYTTPTESSWEAANATKGQVFVYNNEVIETHFASYPLRYYRNPYGFPSYYEQGYLCSDVVCENGDNGREWCTTTLYKMPNKEKFELYMPNTKLSGDTWNGLDLRNQIGHCYGISQVASRYYAEELNYTYEQMAEEFMSPGVQIGSILGTVAEGGTLVAYHNNQYFVRTSQPEATNKYFYSSQNGPYAGGYTGQCTWYAYGRANEVLGTAGSELKWTIWSNAGKWYNQNIQNGNSAFEYNSDVTQPRPGSIIVWGQTGQAGHVAFVEKVNGDGTLDYSESNIGMEKNASNPYGWRYMANQSYEQVKNWGSSSGYYFQGYIYMLK